MKPIITSEQAKKAMNKTRVNSYKATRNAYRAELDNLMNFCRVNGYDNPITFDVQRRMHELNSILYR